MDEKKKVERPVYTFNVSMSGKSGEVTANSSMSFQGPAPEVFDEAAAQIARWKAQATTDEKAKP